MVKVTKTKATLRRRRAAERMIHGKSRVPRNIRKIRRQIAGRDWALILAIIVTALIIALVPFNLGE